MLFILSVYPFTDRIFDEMNMKIYPKVSIPFPPISNLNHIFFGYFLPFAYLILINDYFWLFYVGLFIPHDYKWLKHWSKALYICIYTMPQMYVYLTTYHIITIYHGGFKKLAQAFSNYKSNSFVVFTSCFCISFVFCIIARLPDSQLVHPFRLYIMCSSCALFWIYVLLCFLYIYMLHVEMVRLRGWSVLCIYTSIYIDVIRT